MGVQARGGERSCTGRMSSSRGIALNCGLAAPPTTTTCHTPNTPEILNAIVNISFPTPAAFQGCSYTDPQSSRKSEVLDTRLSCALHWSQGWSQAERLQWYELHPHIC